MTLFGPSSTMIFSQLLLGIINGAFYALVSLGLSVIFGLLRVVNFSHGTMYMLGAMFAWIGLNSLGLSYWVALFLAPLCVGFIGVLIERIFLARIAKLDPLYGLLLTFGLALIIQSILTKVYGSGGLPYPVPGALIGAQNLGFMILPYYRGWVVIASATACLLTWLMIERTRLGSTLRAATENPELTSAFGINVPLLITMTYAFGTALAALAGVLAAPMYSVNPTMGSDLLIVVFAVVVIGGMSSIGGSIITGFALGLVEGLTKVVYAEASSVIIFVVMILVLMVKPVGLFGRTG
jgi:branched-chain amino acid transport system permease protein